MEQQPFQLVSSFAAQGDQPQAIEALAIGVDKGMQSQVLLGVTGSGKTFTMASIIEKVQRPTLVLAHNKTLAAQLCAEFREFFPNNAVEYFVSYYDYYQPEAYIASSDTYIEKDASINDEIERMRHSATASLLERRDVIVVASVSCIYGLGSPTTYAELMVSLRPGMRMTREELVKRLVEIQFERNDVEFDRGIFRVRGDIVEIIPSYSSEHAFRVEFFGDEIERITQIEVVSGKSTALMQHIAIFPASHYANSRESVDAAISQIEADRDARVAEFEREDKLLEAQRLSQRTNYDIEMLREIGYCTGIENYSRYFDGREPGEMPYTLLDYFPDDFLLFIDESHATIPQVRAMYNGDRARKENLVDYGFRLPAAYDNRPLKFDEFEKKLNQVVYVSATPGPYEMQRTEQVVEQIIRPTGLLDPEVTLRPAKGQVDDLLGEIHKTVDKGFRVLVTTLTKRMAESLTDYLQEMDVRVKYLHSDIQTIERTEILRDLRIGAFDVLVGINLLREGLDLPEVALVTILDADKEGFLRSEVSLVQTIGRAARNVEGKVIMYADVVTDSMMRAIQETNRRRALQMAYNEANGITPMSVSKAVRDLMMVSQPAGPDAGPPLSEEEQQMLMERIEDQMLSAAAALDFETAAKLRDKLLNLRGEATPNPLQQNKRRRMKKPRR